MLPQTYTNVCSISNRMFFFLFLIFFKILDLVIDLFNKGGNEKLDVPSTDLPEIPVAPPKYG